MAGRALIQGHHRPLHPSFAEDRHLQMRSVLADNQRLAASHVALKQEIGVAQQEIRKLSIISTDAKAERNAQVREVYDQALKMENEVRSIGEFASELDRVKIDIKKLIDERKALDLQFKEVNAELQKAMDKMNDFPGVKEEIEILHREIHKGRAAIEHEKKTHVNNLEQSQAMEKNMFSMAREIEKLQAELANLEKRARAAEAANPSPGYATNYGKPDLGYGVNPYSDPYGTHQVQGVGGPYAPGAVAQIPYDLHQTHPRQ